MIENKLKYCRENLEMTQKELGYIFGVHESTVSGWETGKDTMPLKKLIKFSNQYDYSIDFIMGLNERNIKYSKLENLDSKKVGENLKKLRLKLNLTQESMAKECMISQTTYSNYEIGLFLINTLTLFTICKNHHISMDELLGRKRTIN